MTDKNDSSKDTRSDQSERYVAHNYRVGLSVYRPDRRVSKASGNKRDAPVAPRTLQRVVTIPDDDPASAWHAFSERQDNLRRARAHTARPRPQSVPRTLAQTGTRATAGRIQAIRRPLPYQASPVPRRSSRRQPHRNIFARLLALFLVLAFFVGSLTFFFAGTMLHVQQVRVIGTHNDALVHIIQNMDIRGQDILFLNSAVLQQRILEIPSVAAVSIQKQIPDQVTILLVERQPVLLWQASDGVFSVDRSGKVIAQATRSPGMNHLPTIIDVTMRGQQKAEASTTFLPLAVGMSLTQANIAFALSVLQLVPQVNHIDAFALYYDGRMYAGINDQEFSSTVSQGSYILQSPQGWKAYLGNAFDVNSLHNRLLELQSILVLAQQQRLALSTIDLRYGLHPAITLR